MSIFMCSTHIFQASLETFSKTFWPSGCPSNGTSSRPSISRWNFTQNTLRAPGRISVDIGGALPWPQPIDFPRHQHTTDLIRRFLRGLGGLPAEDRAARCRDLVNPAGARRMRRGADHFGIGLDFPRN